MPRRLKLQIVAGAIVAVASVAVVVCAALTEFQPFDDEGGILIAIKGVVTGHALYSRTFSQYGPAYFLVMKGLFGAFRLPLTIDVARLVTAALGAVAVLTLSVAAWKATRSIALSALCCILSASVAVTGREAALHPSHLVAVCVAVLVVMSANTRNGRATAFVLGAVLAFVVLSKINAGLLCCASLVTAGTLVRPRLVRMAALLGPSIALEAIAVQKGGASLLVGLLLVATVPVALRLRDIEARPMTRSVPLAAGFLGVAAASVVVAMLAGTGLVDLLRAAFILPLRQPDAFASPAVITGRDFVVVLAVVAAGVISTLKDEPRLGSYAHTVERLAPTLGCVVATWATLGFAVDLPAWARINSLLAAASIAWIILVPGREGATAVRATVATFAVLLPLQAYPVAGGQRFVGSLMLPIVAVLCVRDALGARQARSAAPLIAERSARLTFALAAAVLAVVATASFGKFRDSTPLDLPTARIARVPRHAAVTLRAVTAALRTCRTFYSEPGLNSFYFLAGQAPPTWRNATHWPTLFDDATQREVVTSLSRYPEFCVLRNDKVLTFWLRGGTPRSGPLETYLKTGETPRASFGDYVVFTQR